MDTRLGRIADWCAFLVMGIAALVLVGWVFGIEAFKRVLPHVASMKFNTALCFLIAGTALWSRERVNVRVALGILVALLGALSLSESLMGRDFGIDQLVILDGLAATELGNAPGRMSEVTAGCFILIGVALGLLGWHPVTRRLAEALALSVAVIGIFSLIGYALGVQSLYRVPGFVSVALHTAAAFVVLAMGLLCSVPQGAAALIVRSGETGRVLWLGFGVPTALLMVIGILASVRVQSIEKDAYRLARIDRPRAKELRQLEINLLDYALNVQNHRDGDALAVPRAADDATAVVRHLAEYERLAETTAQQEFAAHFATLWHELHSEGEALLKASPPNTEQQERFVNLRVQLKMFVEDELKRNADIAFETQSTIIFRQIQNFKAFPLFLLVSGVVLALLTGSTVIWTVTTREADLEQRVEERTKQLQGTLSELDRSKVAIEAGSRAKSAFVANMSHEIRTPLNAVIGLTDLVLETPLSADQRNYLTMVQNSGESLLGLINDILDFSKIEADRLELEQVPFKHSEALRDTLKSLGLRARDKNLGLSCRIAPDVPRMVIGDAARLRQVLTNLVGNALKFTERGEVAVDVRCEAVLDQEVQLHYMVRDTGVGIPADQLDRIFQPFEQADASITRRFGGTGLGLTISSRLVELMGGRLWAESQPGRGSTFHFTARFRRSHDPLPATRWADVDLIRDLPVLVVGSNATSRAVLQEMLTNWKMSPAVAQSAAQTLALMDQALLSGRPYRLVIADDLPQMDSFELARGIQQHPQLSGTPIIMLNSGGMPGDRATREQLGLVHGLIKPVLQSELLNAILKSQGAVSVTTDSDATVAQTGSPVIPPLKILLVEDSVVNQTLALAILAKFGHQVTVAQNGREALDLWKNGAFDLVLMDIQMPEMDGLEATKLLRLHERQTGGHTPLIALTAHAMHGDRERCLKAGADDYVSKPIRVEPLNAAIKRALGTAPASVRHELGQVQASVHTKAPTLIDWSVALSNCMGNSELLKNLVEVFLPESTLLVSQIPTAIEEGRADKLHRLAHTMKNHMRIFGAPDSQQLALEIEHAARDGNVNVTEAWSKLQAQIERIHQEMHEFLVGGVSPDSIGARSETHVAEPK